MLDRPRCQTGDVTDRDLVVVSEDPLNAETKLDLIAGEIVPAGRHYVRTHFGVPRGPDRIAVDGAVRAPREITLAEVRAGPHRSLAVTLECAGNGRRFFHPAVPGEQWALGAVGTAVWTGTPLAPLIGADVGPGAVEIVFRGADEGTPRDLERRIAYERSLPVEIALGEDVLVAYEMNGAPIPPEHGGPLRLVVPGWYGMASVKWLARLTIADRPFTGFFQADRYVIDGRPLRAIEPRAVIASPTDGARLRAGRLAVRGYAWSGRAPVERVTLSEDGATIGSADLARGVSPYAWREFRIAVDLGPGEHELVARATDRDGNEQPVTVRWNRLGYANNAARPVRVIVS
jgi:DMSO/TMAO reductase YedYZ molybdopterin-dependent catalytic subunit